MTSATPIRMITPPMMIRGVMGSLSTSAPRMTATAGLT
jgi:hypothetical protein